MPRVRDVLCLEEEKHLLLAKAHLVLAAKCRWNSSGGADQDHVKIRNSLWELQNLLAVASEDVRADKATMLIVVGAHGMALSKCSQDLRADLEVVLEACRDRGRAFQFAQPEMRDSREVVLEAVSRKAKALEFASNRLKEDREVVLAAVRGENDLRRYQGDCALAHAGAGPRNDKEVVLAAVASRSVALTFAGRALREDREVVLTALKTQTMEDLKGSGNVVDCAGEALLADEEIILEAVRVDGAAIRFASLELRKDKDYILKAMRRAPAEQRHACFLKADVSLREAIPAETLLGAAESALAFAGEEDAPVVTVTLNPPAKRDSGIIRGCLATLLSGATFFCSVPDKLPPKKQTFSESVSKSKHNKVRPRSAAGTPQLGPEIPEAPPQHAMSPSATGQRLTLADLALVILAELGRQVEVVPPPRRVFLVLAKRVGDGEAVVITPWDWNRPLTEFL